MRFSNAFISIILLASIAAAQDNSQVDSRANQLEREALAKGSRVSPPQPDKLERGIGRIENSVILQWASGGLNGFGLRFGELATGSGFAIGPAYSRRDLLNENLHFRVSAAGSAKLYYNVDALMSLPRLFGKRLRLDFYAQHADSPQMAYYGPGPNSLKQGRTDYRREDTNFDFRLGWRVHPRYVLAGLTTGVNLINIGPGTSKVYESTDLAYSPSETPGIDVQSPYFHIGPFLQVDFRDRKDDPHRGTNLVMRLSFYEDQADRYTFRTWESLAEQYIPVLNEKRVFALRARTEFSYAGTGQVVPFYLQPTLGGSDDLRGFRQFRYYDNDSLLMNVEYRWEVAPALDMALFGDGGKVFPRPGDISLTNLKSDGGFGLRFKNREAVMFRIDVGFSREGTQIWFKFSPPFAGLYHAMF
jgi:outer membrane protein assembly factor BamA